MFAIRVSNLIRFSFSSDQLRLIALVAMTADHLAWAFLPTVSLAAALAHLLGRIAMPIFCFLLAEGSSHTRNARSYAFRLGGCALLSAIPYSLFISGTPFGAPLSAAYTLLLCLAALCCVRSTAPVLPRAFLLTGILLLALPGDWGIYAVGWCLIFALGKERPRLCGVLFSVLVLLNTARFMLPLLGKTDLFSLFCQSGIQLGSLFALPLLAGYNGARTGGRGRKLFFYLYYPLHLALIDLFLFLGPGL